MCSNAIQSHRFRDWCQCLGDWRFLPIWWHPLRQSIPPLLFKRTCYFLFVVLWDQYTIPLYGSGCRGTAMYEWEAWCLKHTLPFWFVSGLGTILKTQQLLDFLGIRITAREQSSNEQLYWLDVERVSFVNKRRVGRAFVANQQGLFPITIFHAFCFPCVANE